VAPVGRVARFLLLALLLAGCAPGVRLGAPVDPAARRAILAADSAWEARGRIALKAPGASGQGSFTWVQDGEASVLRVSGPFGAGGYEVHWTPDRLTVVSARGEVAADYQGPDAARRFLEQQLGWSLPAGNARWWLLGLPGPASPATETAGPDGLPVALVQDGWTVRYDEYRPAGTLALPRKLVLEGDAGRIRLVIDDWRLD
jgi:outer membrane lipoprotein LolB